MLFNIRQHRLYDVKHYNLLVQIVSNEEKVGLWIRSQKRIRFRKFLNRQTSNPPKEDAEQARLPTR